MIIEKETIQRIHYEMALSQGTLEIRESPDASETYCILKCIDNTIPAKSEETELVIPIMVIESMQEMIHSFMIAYKNNKGK